MAKKSLACAGKRQESTQADGHGRSKSLLTRLFVNYTAEMHDHFIAGEGSGSLEWLCGRTNPGLFVVGGGGPRIWVFESSRRLIALQLDESTERPAFSFYELGRTPVAVGVWMGKVLFRVGAPLNQGAYGQAGFVCLLRKKVLLKANAWHGGSERLTINDYRVSGYSPRTIFYRQWSLLSALDGKLSWFDAPEQISPMRPYLDQDGWDPPRLTLCEC